MISLNQGVKFNNYQNKIKKNVEKQERLFSPRQNKNINKNIKETFTNAETAANINQENTQDSLELTHLKNKFDNLLSQYTNLSQHLNSETTDISNPYLGKNVRLVGSNVLGYVTNTGNFKWYPNAETIKNTAGKNQCPDGIIFTEIDIPGENYNLTGSMLNSNPPIKVGTSMVSGQSCGNEGKNIWVNQIIPQNTSSTYVGCYANNSSMTFIGASPTSSFDSLQNGNFEQPQINNDSYININSIDQVPGWNFNAYLINNSSAWGFPMPYPSGNQAACIQATQIFSQWIQLTTGQYNLTFGACGRPDLGSANTINIYLQINSSSTSPQDAPIIYSFTPELSWGTFNTSFTVDQPGLYSLGFYGTVNNTNNSTAIQNIQLSQGDISSSSSAPNYTYDMCKNAAISSGYKYFGLQDTNLTTGYGYCAVSNDEIASTNSGQAVSATQQIPLWSSNTQGQQGNNAVLTNTGSLSIINLNGTAVFNTPNENAKPSNYLGCYADNENRAMTLYNNGSQEYNLQQCQQIATDSNMMIYGLQNSTSGTDGQCVLSNSLAESQQYGIAGNCTQISDGSWSGGGYSNAIYYNPTPTSSYYLILEDSGLLSINRGNNPSDNQGNIWSFQGTPQDVNPAYSASNSKFGQNWFFQGTTLLPGDFVSSPSGNIMLIMQDDGNLVLYVFQMGSSCSMIQNSEYYGGGEGANALYKIDNVGNKSLMGKIGFVDSNTMLREYPSSMISKSLEYDKISNYDSIGNNLPNMPITSSTANKCTIACNENTDCNGFVFDNMTSNCWLKDINTYPVGEKQTQNNLDLYVRKPELLNSPNCSKEIIPVDSIQYQNYVQGDLMSPDTSCIDNSTNNMNSDINAQLMDLENQMGDLADQIGKKVNILYSNNVSINNNFRKDKIQFHNDYQMYNEVKGKISNLKDEKKGKSYKKKVNTPSKNIETMINMQDLNAMISDSDLLVLQNNYGYVLWSILALGSVIVTINTLKK